MPKDYVLDSALKQGWIQCGSGIPVFFKYDADHYNNEYPFLVVSTCDANAYYHMWNKWVEEEKIFPGDINADRIFNSSFNHYRAKPEQLTTVIIMAISDHYHHTKWSHNPEPEQKKYYNELSNELNKKLHDATNRIQK